MLAASTILAGFCPDKQNQVFQHRSKWLTRAAERSTAQSLLSFLAEPARWAGLKPHMYYTSNTL